MNSKLSAQSARNTPTNKSSRVDINSISLNLYSDRNAEYHQRVAGDSGTSPEKMMALSINCNKGSLNDFSVHSLSKISNSEQRLNEEAPEAIQSAPG
jgi:hypothetical protein